MSQRIQTLAYDRYTMILNGQRVFIRSGAMHYFRLPSQELWYDRLYKLRAAGYNCVDLYFNWGFHSEKQGQYDFTGIRDVNRLMDMTEELGLYVIARPGPYINAEVSGGGFPMWLLSMKDLPLRNRREGAFVWSETYMRYVREWWEQIIPVINRSHNVLMMQIENEYSTLEVEPDTMQALYKMARELGVTVPLSHNDLFIEGLYEDIVDLYAFDNYSVTQFETDWKKMSGTFSLLDNLEQKLRPFCQNRPLVAAELQAGWFGGWKGDCYKDIIAALGREHINISTKTVLAQGLTVFNHYKAIGGTNWNHLGSTETVTSYDFGAPISEPGLNTVRLFEAKALNYFLATFDMNATDRVTDLTTLPMTFDSMTPVYVVRQSIPSDSPTGLQAGRQLPAKQEAPYWLFLRNLESDPATTVMSLPTGQQVPITLSAHDMKILPVGYPLACGLTLAATTVEPMFQDAHRLVFKGNHPVHLVLRSTEPLTVTGTDPASNNLTTQQTQVGAEFITEIKLPALAPYEVVHLRVSSMAVAGMALAEPLTLLALGQEASDRFWIHPIKLLEPSTNRGHGNSAIDLLIGPNAALPGKHWALTMEAQEKLPVMSVSPLGHVHYKKSDDIDRLVRHASAEQTPPVVQAVPIWPALNQWRVTNGAPEFSHKTGFHPVSSHGLDLDANGQHEGIGWYRYALGSQRPKTLEIDAIHIWGAFLNGALIGEGHHLSVTHGEVYDNRVKLPIPPHLYRPEHNELVILVDSLGHPKGFHDDEQQPQGLVHLSIDGKDIHDAALSKHLTFCGGLAYERQWSLRRMSADLADLIAPITSKLPPNPHTHEPEHYPVALAETTFTMPDISQWECPLGLSLKGLDFNRINIYLNHVLVGRHWRMCRCQELFYLPPGLLHTHPEATNHLALAVMNFKPPIHLHHLQELLNTSADQPPVRLVPYDMLVKASFL